MGAVKRIASAVFPWVIIGLLATLIYGWGYRDGRSRGFEAGTDAMRRAILQIIREIDATPTDTKPAGEGEAS